MSGGAAFAEKSVLFRSRVERQRYDLNFDHATSYVNDQLVANFGIFLVDEAHAYRFAQERTVVWPISLRPSGADASST